MTNYRRPSPVPFWDTIVSPVGPLLLCSDGVGLTGLHFQAGPNPQLVRSAREKPCGLLWVAAVQLAEYFDGRRRTFDLPLAWQGTDFQQQVWRALTEIPFGRTLSYAELASVIGRPRASRAVGLANGANPIPIVVPCHRVIGSNGSLTGFGGGLSIKRWLLAHEGAASSDRTIDMFRTGGLVR